LQARIDDLTRPGKTPNNSSVPPSKGHKPNRSDKAKREGPRKGSLGRKGGGRALTAEPDEVVLAKPSAATIASMPSLMPIRGSTRATTR
jgi:transposase